jgi:hypothetical protein
VGPLGRRSDVEQVAAALRLAYGLRSCRGARPVEGTCLQGRLGRCLAPCRGGTDAAAHDAAAQAVRSLLVSGGTVPVDRLRERRRKLVAALRFEEAAAVRDLETALRRAGRTLAALRRARSRHGVVLAAHRDPRLVAAFVVASGVVVERRGLPRVGGAELEVSSLLSTLRRAAAATDGLDGAEAARRHDELLHVDATFDRPAAGVVPLAVTREQLLAGTDHGLGRRVAEARMRVPPPVTARAAATNPSARGGPVAASRAGQAPGGVETANRRPRASHGAGPPEASGGDRFWQPVELPL